MDSRRARRRICAPEEWRPGSAAAAGEASGVTIRANTEGWLSGRQEDCHERTALRSLEVVTRHCRLQPMVQISPAVQSIRVKDLFGRYSYVIDTARDSRFIILYGDNGAGKTTILNVLFHVLSTGRQRGHRTALRTVPFRSFEVDMDNSLTIFATREAPGVGSYTYGVREGDVILAQTGVLFDEADDMVHDPRLHSELDGVLSVIEESIPLDVYHIGDDRSVVSDNIAVRIPEDEFRMSRRRHHLERRRGPRTAAGSPRSRNLRSEDLVDALAEATEWATRQVMGATRAGTASANSIYSDVIGRIAKLPISVDDSQSDLTGLIEKLDELEARDRDYEPFGLAPGFTATDLTEALLGADRESQRVIIDILGPYLETVEARLDAVASLQETLSTFVLWMNGFLKDKRVTVSLPRGIEIQTEEGDLLSPDSLSSGEQQLLLLLASTLYAQETPSLFIIDEPELSLNVKWQRQLLEVLTECTRGSSTQFVFATHSFEILSSHREHVIDLTHEDTGPLTLGPGQQG